MRDPNEAIPVLMREMAVKRPLGNPKEYPPNQPPGKPLKKAQPKKTLPPPKKR